MAKHTETICREQMQRIVLNVKCNMDNKTQSL